MDLEFVTELNIAIARPRGEFSIAYALGWAPALLSDPRYRPGMHHIYDLSGMNPVGVAFDEMHALADAMRGRASLAGHLIAYVAPDDLAFGLARMFLGIVDADQPARRTVVRSMEEALLWIAARDVPVPPSAGSS